MSLCHEQEYAHINEVLEPECSCKATSELFYDQIIVLFSGAIASYRVKIIFEFPRQEMPCSIIALEPNEEVQDSLITQLRRDVLPCLFYKRVVSTHLR